MGVIWTSRTRSRQPQGESGLSLGNPIARGLKFIETGYGRDIKDGRLPVAGTATKTVGPPGRGLTFNGSSDYQRYVNPTGFTVPLSLFIVFTVSSVPNSTVFGLFSSTSDTNGIVALRTVAGSIAVYTYEPTAGYVESAYTAGVPTGVVLTAGASVSAAGGKTAYLAGVPTATTTHAISLSASDRLSIGQLDRASPGDYFPGTIFLAAAWDRVLSAAEFAELNRNPWQLFAPERRPVFYSLPAPSGTSSAVVWNARPRTRQPQTVARLNENISKDAAIVYCPPFGAIGSQVSASRYGIVRGAPTAITRIPTPFGVGEGNAGGLTGADYAGRYWTGITLAAQYTVLAAFYDRTGRGTIRSLVTADNDWAIRSFQFRVESSNSVGFIPFNTGGIPFIWASSNTTSSTGLNVAVARLGPGGVGSIALNGVFTSPGTLTGTPHTTPDQVSVGQFSGNTADNSFKDGILVAGIINRYLTDDEVRAYTNNLWKLFAPERRPKFFSVGSGANTYAVGISETATASETVSMLAAFGASISETVTANETIIASAVFGSAISETVTASQTNASVVTFTTAVNETSTASDTIAAAIGAGTFAATISETATASETVSATAAFVASISETATASDSISSLVSFISAVSETATASDSIAAQLANQTYAATVLESVTASDIIVGTVPTVYAAAVIETISISDIAGATVTNPSTFWTQVTTTQSAGWGQINNTQSSGWTIIPTT